MKSDIWASHITPVCTKIIASPRELFKVGLAGSCFGVDHDMLEIPGLISTLGYIDHGERKLPALGPFRRAAVRVAVDQHCASDSLKVRGQMNGGCCLADAALVVGHCDVHAYFRPYEMAKAQNYVSTKLHPFENICKGRGWR